MQTDFIISRMDFVLVEIFGEMATTSFLVILSRIPTQKARLFFVHVLYSTSEHDQEACFGSWQTDSPHKNLKRFSLDLPKRQTSESLCFVVPFRTLAGSISLCAKKSSAAVHTLKESNTDSNYQVLPLS